MRSFVCAVFCIAFFGCEVRRTDDGFGEGLIGQETAVVQQAEKDETREQDSKHPSESPIPWENRKETAQPPLPDEDTEDHVREMFAELAKGNPGGVGHWLMPLELLQRIKDMHMPSPEENRRAVSSLHAELMARTQKRAARFLARNPMKQASFESLELGNCRFVPAGRDFNRLSFWLCEKNRIYYHVEGERKHLEVRTLVNWGRTWHLWEW